MQTFRPCSLFSNGSGFRSRLGWQLMFNHSSCSSVSLCTALRGKTWKAGKMLLHKANALPYWRTCDWVCGTTGFQKLLLPYLQTDKLLWSGYPSYPTPNTCVLLCYLWLMIKTSVSPFGARVTFSHHNKFSRNRRHIITSVLTSVPEIADRIKNWQTYWRLRYLSFLSSRPSKAKSLSPDVPLCLSVALTHGRRAFFALLVLFPRSLR